MATAAPPRQPTQDELQALIEEARRRARRRRRRTGTLAAALLLLAAGSYETVTQLGRTPVMSRAHRTAAQAAAIRCAASQFRTATRGVRSKNSGATYILTITNLGPSSCRIDGAPKIWLITADGKAAFRPPQTVANHSASIDVAPEKSASVWVDFLAPGENRVISAKQLALKVKGIRGVVHFKAKPHSGELDNQQLVVSAFAPGLVHGLPASTSSAPRCRRLALTRSRSLGAWTGHYASALVLTNTGRTPCSIDGFPRLAVANLAGRHLYDIPEDHSGASATVQLAPEGHASAWTIEPNCNMSGGSPVAYSLRARQSISLPGLRNLVGTPALFPSAWPKYCAVTVSAVVGGIFQGVAGTDQFPESTATR